MTLMERYQEALSAYWRTHRGAAPDNPTQLYLGDDEWAQFRAFVKDQFDATVPDVIIYEMERPEFRGAKVYRVNEQSHIAFSP